MTRAAGTCGRTGPEHFQAAEKLLAAITVDDCCLVEGEHGNVIAAAQAHATLALAAATRDVAKGTAEAGTALSWWANDGVLPVRVVKS